MAPKTLRRDTLRREPPASAMPGGDFAYWQGPPPTFSMYNAQYEPATFAELIRTRQCEQLWIPGQLWPGIQTWETLQVLPGPQPLSALPAIAATLYPGREHFGIYTAVELWVIQNTLFHFLFRQLLPGVPRTLGDDMATFMLWITFPSSLIVPKLLQALRGELFEIRGHECAWLSDQVLNFSFSPRSALDVHVRTFNKSSTWTSEPGLWRHGFDFGHQAYMAALEHFAQFQSHLEQTIS